MMNDKAIIEEGISQIQDLFLTQGLIQEQFNVGFSELLENDDDFLSFTIKLTPMAYMIDDGWVSPVSHFVELFFDQIEKEYSIVYNEDCHLALTLLNLYCYLYWDLQNGNLIVKEES